MHYLMPDGRFYKGIFVLPLYEASLEDISVECIGSTSGVNQLKVGKDGDYLGPIKGESK